MTGIYFAQVGRNNLKVGQSRNIAVRLRSLRSQTHQRVRLISVKEVPERQLWQEEAIALRVMGPYRWGPGTEWHQLTAESVATALSISTRYSGPDIDAVGWSAYRRPKWSILLDSPKQESA